MPRPNIVLFMPDQLRADCVGAFGNAAVKTPNIDALAARGTAFTSAYAQNSFCSPSRASLLTGWYPHVTGHRTLNHLIKPWEPNMLSLLKEAGYTVLWAGLRGDTFAEGLTAKATDHCGFLTWPDQGHGKPTLGQEHVMSRCFYYGRREPKHDEVVVDFDEATIRTAEGWLAERPKEPWVLFVCLTFPHPPFVVEEPWFSLHDRSAMPLPHRADLSRKPNFMAELARRYGTASMSEDDWRELVATYYGMISRVDWQLGRVMQAVERTGAQDRTATFFFTDHGEYLGDYGLVEKWHAGADDCLLRNPLIAAVPGFPQGRSSDSLVELLDVMPTVLELAGAEARHCHFGRSLLPVLSDPATRHKDAVFAEVGFRPNEEPVIETTDFFPYATKIHLMHEDIARWCGRAVSVRTKDHAFVHRRYEADELYDRAGDPHELVNLSGRPEHAATERALKDLLLDWYAETSDVVPWDLDPRFDPELWKDRPAPDNPKSRNRD
ncbi:MAG: sulfatase-like hydrolase/transferase [Alphaproteobacteria bacterium]|nr:sulfatase-like hydrolase/transferase [Alphaproteobacteria bacterium]